MRCWIFHFEIGKKLQPALNSYADYAVLAKRLDEAKGAEAWKAEKESHLYSASELQDKIDRSAPFREKNTQRGRGKLWGPELYAVFVYAVFVHFTSKYSFEVERSLSDKRAITFP